MGFFSEFKWFHGKKDEAFVPVVPVVIDNCAADALKEPEKKIIKKLFFYPVTFDVKRALVEVTLKDKRKFKTFIYGAFSQYCGQRIKGYNGFVTEAVATEPIVSNGLQEAQNWIKGLHHLSHTLVDDSQNPKKCVVGEILSAVIKEVEPYSMTFQVGKIEEVTDEEVI